MNLCGVLIMPKHLLADGSARGKPDTDAVVAHDASLKPALASIKAACDHMGGISRAKFYADILPQLETVALGSRKFVVVSSMDRLIEANTRPAV
jgi:hypothetical protein